MKDKRFLRDLALIAALFFAALIIFAAGALLKKEGNAVEVRVGGELLAELPLSEDAKIDVAGKCILLIENGEARVEASTCRNKICVKHRAVKNAGEVIVCLPNGVTVKVVGSGGSDLVI